jgi:hypothetical protein
LDSFSIPEYPNIQISKYPNIQISKYPYIRMALMNYESILVVTYGRTGSTLLQGVLNSIDGCLIRGENYGVCQGLFRSYRNMIKSKDHSGHAPTEPWFGCQFLNEDYVIEHGRELMRRVLLGDQAANNHVICYGFKETRYVNMEPDYLFDYIDFICKLFPNPAVIFNTRALSDVVKSAWWKEKEIGKITAMLKQTEGVFSRYANEHHNCFQITYEDTIAKTAVLERMFEFLGVHYDESNIDRVLSRPHSYAPTQEHIEEMFVQRNKNYKQ